MLRQLERKVGTVAKVLDGQDENLNIEILQKGEIGNFTVQTQQKSVKGSKITDYFAPIKPSSQTVQGVKQEIRPTVQCKTEAIQVEKDSANSGLEQQRSKVMLRVTSSRIGKKYWVNDFRFCSSAACALQRLNRICLCDPLKQNSGPRLNICLYALEAVQTNAAFMSFKVCRFRICSKRTEPLQHTPNPKKYSSASQPAVGTPKELIPSFSKKGPPKKQILLNASSPYDWSNVRVICLSLWMKGIRQGLIWLMQRTVYMKLY